MYRFKASKYKNCVPKPAKRENCFTDVSVEAPNSYGNLVACGVKYLAFAVGQASGGKVAVFDVNDSGRKGQSTALAAHSGSITDFTFSPFYHDLLVTAADDARVKIWKIPSSGISTDLNPTQTLTGFAKRPEVVQHHPLTDIMAVTSENVVKIFDLQTGSSHLDCQVEGDFIQSASWSGDGRQIACTTKDKHLHVVDPRAGKVTGQTKAHDNHKDSRALWLGQTGKILTTGFSSSRECQFKVFDQRNLSSCLNTTGLGTNSGVAMPFYDADASLLFIGCKGNSSLSIYEVTDASPCISPASQTMLPDQTKGMGIAPKIAVDVMECEVDRILQLCARQLVPVKIEVPRKSHNDFASDLFPDTDSDEVAMAADAWLAGQDAQRKKCSLDPGRRAPLVANSDSVQVHVTSEEPATPPVKSPSVPVAKSFGNGGKVELHEAKNPLVLKPFAGVRTSKFRHWKGTVLHPSTHITNITNLSNSLPGSCDGFDVNPKFAAVPIATPGGHVAILEVTKPERITGTPPSVQNGASITDCKWNPFNAYQLAVGLDDGLIKIWNISRSGLKGVATKPDNVLEGHNAKVTSIQFHPLARDLLASASFDNKVLIWNVESGDRELELSGHDDEILHLNWSADGKCLATVARDNRIRIFEPRKSPEPIKVGPGPSGGRGARVAWMCDDTMLFVSGFNKQGTRTIDLHDVTKLDKGPLVSLPLTSSPSTLIPHVDQENNIVFLSGKGDSLLTSYEVLQEEPFLAELSAFKSDGPCQGFCFQHKSVCDVRKVEIARAWRLGKSSLEPVSFTVPRVKLDFFQDDLFPDIPDGQPSVSASVWLSGGDSPPERISLRPSDMKKLSEAPKEAPKQRKFESYNADTFKTDEQKKDELVSAMSKKLDLDKELEQDTMDGVDEDEWDDY